MKIIHHERKRLDSHFSIERLFGEIRSHMPADCEVTSRPVPYPSRGIFPRWRNMCHASRQRADVHHVVGDSHYLVLGLPRERTVLTIHDCGALNRLTGWKRALLKYFWFTGPMRRAAVVTTISETSKEELRKWVGALADKVVVVSDCVVDEFAYDPKPFDAECPVILQVGTKWNKNVERVMEAMRETGCRLEVVGELDKASHSRPQGGRQLEELSEAVKLTRMDTDESDRHVPPGLRGGCSALGDPSTRNLSSNEKAAEAPEDLKFKTPTGLPAVQELGRLTDQELVEAYRRCDMVVFTSLYEGFGLPILEAQAIGRPVITSNFGAMREAAGDGALLVDPFSVEEIRAAILRIRNEPGLREELVQKGLKNVAGYRAESIAARYAEIYRAVAKD